MLPVQEDRDEMELIREELLNRQPPAQLQHEENYVRAWEEFQKMNGGDVKVRFRVFLLFLTRKAERVHFSQGQPVLGECQPVPGRSGVVWGWEAE